MLGWRMATPGLKHCEYKHDRYWLQLFSVGKSVVSLIGVHCASGAVESSFGAIISSQPGVCMAFACASSLAEMHRIHGCTPRRRRRSHSFFVGKVPTIVQRDIGAVGAATLNPPPGKGTNGAIIKYQRVSTSPIRGPATGTFTA